MDLDKYYLYELDSTTSGLDALKRSKECQECLVEHVHKLVNFLGIVRLLYVNMASHLIFVGMLRF